MATKICRMIIALRGVTLSNLNTSVILIGLYVLGNTFVGLGGSAGGLFWASGATILPHISELMSTYSDSIMILNIIVLQHTSPPYHNLTMQLVHEPGAEILHIGTTSRD